MLLDLVSKELCKSADGWIALPYVVAMQTGHVMPSETIHEITLLILVINLNCAPWIETYLLHSCNLSSHSSCSDISLILLL